MIIIAPRFLNFIGCLFGFGYPVSGLALMPFIFVYDENVKSDKRVINHERIHIRQQMELLFFIFFIWYFVAMYRKGYIGISFEREAYYNDHDLKYLKNRPWFAFIKYIN